MHHSKILNIVSSILLLTIGTAISFYTPDAKASTENLLPNSSFEATSDTLTPTDWTTNTWGTQNASFNYSNNAHTGSKSVKTTVSDYIDGDAKWLLEAVPVQSGAKYIYSDWSISDTETFLWAQYIKVDGNVQYVFINEVAPSENWTKSVASLVIPSDVVSAAIYHVIASNGTLTLDDTSLTKMVDCDTATAGLVLNGGFEEECNTPQLFNGWSPIQYETSSASFASSSDLSHSGTKSAVFTNVDEDAEVGYETTVYSPASNQRYLLSFWHADSTYVYAYIAFTLNNGSVEYKSLMSAPTTLGDWSQYTDAFTTPANTQSLTITIATSGIGSVHLDDVSLTTQPVLSVQDFSTPMISITFDDGAKSTYNNTLSSLLAHGYLATFYLNAGRLNTSGYMSSANVQAIVDQGHEIGSHLYHHSDIVQIDTATLQSELQGNKTALQQIIGLSQPVTAFASPYGSYTSGKVDTVMEYVTSHRTTDGMLNTKDNFNVRQIHGRLVTAGTSIEQFKDWIIEAKEAKAWLVLVYHNIAASSTGQDSDVAAYNVTPTHFSQQMTAISQNEIPVKTVQSALTTLSAEY